MDELFINQYTSIEKSLYLIAVGYLHNTEDARDAMQEAVISAWSGYDKLKKKEYFKTWITRIVINKCKDFLRQRKYTCELTDNADAFYDMPAQDMEIMDAICHLEPGLVPYITLRFYNDMTYEEVAKSLKIPVSTVKYRTKTALDKLKRFLKGDENYGSV